MIKENDKHSIGDLLNNRNPFFIPKYQRSYSWESEEVDAFCNDLKEIDGEYFFGGIVSVHEISKNGPGRTYRIVDGQQRLVTFTLLIAQLKNAFEDIQELAKKEKSESLELTARSLVVDLNDNYLTYNDTRERPPVRKNRLTLSKIDNEFYKELLKNNKPKPKAESHKRIQHAWDTLNKKLIRDILKDKTITVSEKIDRLQEIKDKLLEQSVVIHITCDDLDGAYQLFEVLNDRGRELATGDFLRSTTLELLEKNHDLQDNVSEIWDKILSKTDNESFLKSYLTSHIAKIKRTNLHKQFKEANLFPSSKPEDIGIYEEEQIKDRLINLENQYEIFEKISEGTWPYVNSSHCLWEKKRLFMLIKQLDHKLCIPFLLTLYENSDEKTFYETILNTEKFVFRYISVASLRPSKLSEVYSRHIISMRTNNSFNLEMYQQDLRKIIMENCNDSIFEESINNTMKYKNSNLKKIKYFLLTVESYYKWFKNNGNSEIPKPDTSVIYDSDNLEIEHIYPQNPLYIIDELEPLKNNIGNLAFWSPNDNKIAGNKTFSEKKDYYKRSNVMTTRDLGELSDWNINEVSKRDNMYICMAKSIFNI